MQKMVVYSRSSIQNVNNWRFWIRKKNVLLHLIKEQDSDELIEKIYLYAKDLNEPKHRLLLQKCEDVGKNI